MSELLKDLIDEYNELYVKSNKHFSFNIQFLKKVQSEKSIEGTFQDFKEACDKMKITFNSFKSKSNYFYNHFHNGKYYNNKLYSIFKDAKNSKSINIFEEHFSINKWALLEEVINISIVLMGSCDYLSARKANRFCHLIKQKVEEALPRSLEYNGRRVKGPILANINYRKINFIIQRVFPFKNQKDLLKDYKSLTSAIERRSEDSFEKEGGAEKAGAAIGEKEGSADKAGVGTDQSCFK